MNNEQFITQELIPLLRRLDGSEQGAWGVLSAQGMVEHLTNSFGEAWNRIPRSLQTPAEALPKWREFALSDKEFRPNTKNAMMSEAPTPLRHATITDAVKELEQEVASFVAYHKANPGINVMNPFFGELSYDEWLHLGHKHARHHLRQFHLL
jgi:hypothetical protein